MIPDGFIQINSSGSETQAPTLEQIKEMGRAIFGGSDSTGGELQWSIIKSDNALVSTLKKTAGIMAYMLEKEIKQAEKDIKQAEKVFYGR